MNRSRLLAIIPVVGMLLALIVVGSGLAQVPKPDSEPDVPLYPAEREGADLSSQPPAFDSSVAPAIATSEPTEAQHNSSGPIAVGASVSAPSCLLPLGTNQRPERELGPLVLA